MANINQLKKIDYALRHQPDLIKLLYADCSIKNGLITSRLRRAVPHRIGIEFECCGSLGDWLRTKHPNERVDREFIRKKYSILEFSEDWSSSSYRNDDFNEIRVSIKDFTQLNGLYRILNDMKSACTLPIGGGIHIHIDMRNFLNNDSDPELKRVLANYITNNLDKIESILPKYEGTFNKRKVGIRTKKTYVNLSYLNTVEFRILPLTFEYETLITWIIDLNKFLSEMINRCHLRTNNYSNKSAELVDQDIIREYVIQSIDRMNRAVNTYQLGRHRVSIDTASSNGGSYTSRYTGYVNDNFDTLYTWMSNTQGNLCQPDGTTAGEGEETFMDGYY